MESKGLNEVEAQYDECIKKINELSEHIKLLSGENQLQNLQQIIVPDQYLTLLANSLYTVNSLAYSYSLLKNVQMPSQFSKVQQYYKMAKNPLVLQPSSKPSVVVNKAAAHRVIQHSLK